MTIKARSGATNKNTDKKAPKLGTTPADRKLLDQAEREAAEGSKAPAAVLRRAKADMEASVTMPRATEAQSKAAVAKHADAQKAIAELSVPMTLAEICEVIGVNCNADEFASTAMETLAGQMSALRTIAENEQVDSYEAYRLMDNLVERMRLASRVTAWLESETVVDALPGTAP